MKPILELPITLRPPRVNEVPNNPSILARLELRKTANIVEGYKILLNDNTESAFRFYAEINVDNSKLWKLTLELINELPDEVALIFNHIDTDPNYGKYVSKSKTLEFLKKYRTEISSDTFIDIGLIFHSDSELMEIFIPSSKYIMFWGIDQESFLEIMNGFNLKEVCGIEFVDEYPKVKEPLRLFKDNITDSVDFIERLKEEFVQ